MARSVTPRPLSAFAAASLFGARLLVASLFVAACGAEALAGDAYWHGRFDRVWQSPTPGKGRPGNWYTKAPPRGAKTDIPTGTAIFASGAQRTGIWFNKKRDADDPYIHVGTIFVARGAPDYHFTVQEGARVSVEGQGFHVQTNFEDSPQITVKPDAILKFTGTARVVSRLPEVAGAITVETDGQLRFEAFSRGGALQATVFGKVVFDGESSAEKMTFNVGNLFGASFGALEFKDRSSPDEAYLFASSNATIDLSRTRGPLRDGRLTARKVWLYGGNLRLGDNSLTVSDTLQQDGYLYVEMRGRKIGEIIVKGDAFLNGTIVVEEKPAGSYPKRGRYRVLKARQIRGGLTLVSPYSGLTLDNDTVPGEIHLVVP